MKYFTGDREWITEQHLVKCIERKRESEKQTELKDRIEAKKQALKGGHKRIKSFVDPASINLI